MARLKRGAEALEQDLADNYHGWRSCLPTVENRQHIPAARGCLIADTAVSQLRLVRKQWAMRYTNDLSHVIRRGENTTGPPELLSRR